MQKFAVVGSGLFGSFSNIEAAGHNFTNVIQS
jgi:hypothetical protein